VAIIKTKKCHYCDIDKPITDFYRNGGKNGNCIKCSVYLKSENKKLNSKSKKTKWNRYYRKYRVKNKERIILNNAKRRSIKNNLDFNLTINDIIIPTHCPVLGIELCRDAPKVSPNSPTLDRIDNTKGYVKGNICIISHKANQIKNCGTLEDHQKIVEYMQRNIKG
jgi:hypothetical protein